jgi:hypothetical protein
MEPSETEVKITRSKSKYTLIAVVFTAFTIIFSMVPFAPYDEIEGDAESAQFVWIAVAVFCLGVSIFCWRRAFSNKPVIVINTEGIYYKEELFFWTNIKGYHTFYETSGDNDILTLMISFKNHKPLSIPLNDLDTDAEHIEECIKKFSVNHEI